MAIIYIRRNLETSRVVGILTEAEREELHRTGGREAWAGIENRNDWRDFATVELIANDLSALTGDDWLPVDRGAHVSPRYDVVVCPKVGEDVSRGFNGDYYPVGKIIGITGAGRRSITTMATDGSGVVRKFYRVKLSGAWKEGGGSPFCLVPGVRHEWNPEF
jgi:fermentation-respiration switch protein FrsA (DUF1100 family)